MTTEELVMLHYDGELDPERTREVEALLARDAGARALLQRFQNVGALVKEAHAARAPDVDLTLPILERVNAADPGTRGVQPASLTERRKRRAAAWAVGGLALAAGVTLFLGRPAAPPERAAAPPDARSLPTRRAVALPVSVEAEPAEAEVAVESVDFGTRQGAIFLVPSAETQMLVVWTLDDETTPARGIDL